MPLAMRRRLNLSHGLLLRKGIWAGTQYAPLRQGSVLTYCPPWLCSTVLSVTTSSLVEQAREGSPDCPHPGNSPVNGTLWLLPKPTFSGSWASTSFLSLRSRKGRSTLCRRRIMRMVSSSFRSTWVPDSKSQPCLQKRGARHGDGQLCHEQQLELVVLWARRSTLPREGENSATSFMECLRSRYHGWWSPLCFPPTPRTHLTAGSWASLSCYQFGVYNHNVS